MNDMFGMFHRTSYGCIS